LSVVCAITRAGVAKLKMAARRRLDRLPPQGSDSEVEDERPFCQHPLLFRFENSPDINERVRESKTRNDDAVLAAWSGYPATNVLVQVCRPAERKFVAVVVGRHACGRARILMLARWRTHRDTPNLAQQRSVLRGYQRERDGKDG
jgi:hypothetical protein